MGNTLPEHCSDSCFWDTHTADDIFEDGVLCCIEGEEKLWSECHMQVNRFRKNCYFKCRSREEAMSCFSCLEHDHQCRTYKKAKRCPTNNWATCLGGVVNFVCYSNDVVYVILSHSIKF